MVSSKTVNLSLATQQQLREVAKERKMTEDELIQQLIWEYQRAQRMQQLREQFAATSEEDIRSYEEEVKPWQDASVRDLWEVLKDDDWGDSVDGSR